MDQAEPQPDTQPPHPARPRWGRLLRLAAVAAGGGALLLLGLFVFSDADAAAGRLAGIGIIVLLLGLAWLDNRIETLGKARPWRRLAAATGLCFEEYGSLLLGQSVQVGGTYRGRRLRLYTRRQGKGQVASTRIDLLVRNNGTMALRLRGPFARNSTEIDRVTRNLFETTAAQQLGDDQRFFVRSQPPHLATALRSHPGLWGRLQSFSTLATIELDGPLLMFEQLGVVTDEACLQRMLGLLSDLADMIEVWGFGSVASPTATETVEC